MFPLYARHTEYDSKALPYSSKKAHLTNHDPQILDFLEKTVKGCGATTVTASNSSSSRTEWYARTTKAKPHKAMAWFWVLALLPVALGEAPAFRRATLADVGTWLASDVCGMLWPSKTYTS